MSYNFDFFFYHNSFFIIVVSYTMYKGRNTVKIGTGKILIAHDTDKTVDISYKNAGCSYFLFRGGKAHDA